MPTRTLSAGHALMIIVGALVIGLLLNAGDLLETARRQSPGVARTLSVGVMEPLAAATDAVGLDTPRAAIDQWLGRAETGDSVVAGDAVTPPPTTIPSEVAAASASTTTTTTLPTPTEASPLSLFVAGDSMVGQYGPVLAGRAERSGVVEGDYFFEFSSGLSRPDFFDWSAKLAEIRTDHDPDVLVLYLGGNDAQDILDDGEFLSYAVDSEPWHAEYRARVRELMAELDASGMRTYWMGMPIVRSDTMMKLKKRLNEIYAEEAAGFDGVSFVDTTDWFVDESGAYSEYLPDDSGTLTDMRQGDGIHLTTAGAVRLAERVFPLIASDYGLPG